MQKVGLITWLDLGGLGRGQKSTFSEHGCVAYQIKGNKTYNNIQYLRYRQTALTLGVG